ncbi:MAG: aminotransferase class I/II-fold pyridoxal phosphate-dependent enzyme [Planctomycetes bacterium]|nr:aminotransferase class I/II-fold pyridoxal phosphate-dependent enzyme [Planctomycetota bacterium]
MQTRTKPIPFSRPTIDELEIDEVVDSLRSGWITSGPKVERFEAMFRERLGVEHAVAVNSATAGLHLAIACLDLQPGDEVIVPTLTWASTANVVELCGGRTVFADVDPGTLCLDPEDARRRITPRTRAIVPVHYAGQPADLDPLRAMAQEHGLALIEDAAHALGTFYRGEEVGASGGVTVYSFHPIKNITTGEGGMIVLDDEALAERLRLLRFHGVSKNAWKRYSGGGRPRYEVVEPGYKYNMLDLQAALGIQQLKKLEAFNARRAELAERYGRLLAEVPEITPLARVDYPAVHCWHLYIVRLDLSAVTLDRDDFMQALGEEQVGTGLHFPPLHTQSFFREKYGYREGSLPHAEQAGEEIFSLPLYPLLTDEDQDDVVSAIKKVVAAHRSAP